jgi:hypothetical protein
LYSCSAAIGQEIESQRHLVPEFSGEMTYRNWCIRQIKPGAIDMTNEELSEATGPAGQLHGSGIAEALSKTTA